MGNSNWGMVSGARGDTTDKQDKKGQRQKGQTGQK